MCLWFTEDAQQENNKKPALIGLKNKCGVICADNTGDICTSATSISMFKKMYREFLR